MRKPVPIDTRVRDIWLRICGEAGNATLPLLMESGRIFRCSVGQALIEHREASNAVFIVLTGAFKVVRYSENGHEIWLGEVGRGDLVGEMGPLSGQPRSSSVIARKRSDVFSVPGGRFLEIMKQDSQVAFAIAQLLAQRVAATTNRMVELVSLPVSARLHSELVRVGIAKPGDDEAFEIPEDTTISGLCGRIHATREATSRAMTELELRGVVDRSAKPWVVIAPRL